MKRWKLLWKIFQTVGLDKMVLAFILMFVVVTLAIRVVEPSINGIQDSFWYTFAVVSTIGFGDIVAQTSLGRILTGILSINSILVLAMIPGVLVNYFTEINKIKMNESIMSFFDKLENLENLSKEELREISEKVKERRNKI